MDTDKYRRTAFGWRTFITAVTVLGALGILIVAYNAATVSGVFGGDDFDSGSFFAVALVSLVSLSLLVGVYYLLTSILEAVADITDAITGMQPTTSDATLTVQKTPADSFLEGSLSAADGSEKRKGEVTILGWSLEAARRALQDAIDREPLYSTLTLDMTLASPGASGKSVVVAAAQAVQSRRLSKVTFKNLPTPLEEVSAAAALEEGLRVFETPAGMTLAFKREVPDTSPQATAPNATTMQKPSESPDDAARSEQDPDRTDVNSTADPPPDASKHPTAGEEDRP